MFIIGIDPGPVSGVCLLRTPDPAGKPDAWVGEFAQCTPDALWALLAMWIDRHPIRAVAHESFVVGHRASRVNDPAASKAARDIEGGLRLAIPSGIHRISRRAADIKTWASEARLKACGLHVGGKALVHARDGAKHALYAACHDFGVRVPRIGVVNGPHLVPRTTGSLHPSFEA